MPCWTVIGGALPPEEGEDYEVAVVSHGVTAEKRPRDILEFDNAAFNKNVVPTFLRFVRATQGEPFPFYCLLTTLVTQNC